MKFILELTNQYLKDNSIKYDGDLSIVRGLQLKERGGILINLSAQQFKVKEEIFIQEVTNTITHELVHKLIEDNATQFFTSDGEERVCVSMTK